MKKLHELFGDNQRGRIAPEKAPTTKKVNFSSKT
jgi:hypothetical protein